MIFFLFVVFWNVSNGEGTWN